MSRFLKHTLRCVVFLAVLALLLTGVSQLVRPKNNTRSDGIHDPAANGILGEPDNTIDLLILGDSESYSAFIPMQLWQQYGYTAYCCGTSRQTLYYSEAFLHKAFQKQSPKLVILETDVIFIDFSYGSMLLQEAGDLFPVFSYHDRWKTLKSSDWSLNVNYTYIDNAKGYQLRCNATPADASNYMTPSDAYAPIPKRNRAYVERIKAFCDENGAQLLLVSSPSTVNWNMARHNSTQALADKLQIPFIDFNTMSDQVPINWSTDTRDQGDHLNYFGAKKVTAALGDYLSDNSLLPSHKDDPEYSDWDTQADHCRTRKIIIAAQHFHVPEQAKHRLLRLLRFKIKSQEHTESPIVFPGENGERQYRSPKALHSEFLRFPSASRMRAISAPACKRRGHARFCSIAALPRRRVFR